MGDEMEEADDGMAGGLDEFLAQAISEGDDDGDRDQGTEGDPEVEAQGDREGTDQGDPDEPEQPRDSRSRLVANIAKQEKALTGARSKIKELEQRVEQLSRQVQDDPDDYVEMLRGRVARKMGLEPNDPAVSERLFEISQDVTVQHLGEAVDKDPELKRRRERVLEERRIKDERRDLERRKAELERQQQEREVQEQRRGAVEATRAMLTTGKHPFLTAAVDDAADLVTDLALRAIREGQATVKSHEDGARLLQTIARNLEEHHRDRAKRLAKLLGPSEGTRLDTDMDNDARGSTASRKQGGARKRGAAGGTMGGGGRGRPEGRAQDDESDQPEELHEFVNRMAQRAQSQRRGVR